MTTATMNETGTTNEIGCGTQVAFNQIAIPGCYVCNDTGHLLRVKGPNEVGNWNCSFEMTGSRPFNCTWLCDDADCDIETARSFARSCGASFNF